jgi:hypothetical protein
MKEVRSYIHIKEYTIWHISDRFKGSVYHIYEAITDNPEEWEYDRDLDDLHTVYNGEIDAEPDFTDEELEEYEEVNSQEVDFTKLYFDESLENESDWDCCWKENESDEFGEAVKKVLEEYCKESKEDN